MGANTYNLKNFLVWICHLIQNPSNSVGLFVSPLNNYIPVFTLDRKLNQRLIFGW